MIDFLLQAWTFLYSLAIALFLFGITVFIHEFGHFLVARRCGLIVKAFSIGFGKAVVRWEKDGVHYKIGWIPFGGYVSLPQLDPAGMEKIQGEHGDEPAPAVSPWKKIAVAVCGPLGNVVLAAVLAVSIWLMPGGETGTLLRPMVGQIETNSAAYAAGLRKGDEITAVNGNPVASWYDLTVETLLKKGNIAELTLKEGAALKVPVTTTDEGVPLIKGVDPAVPCLFGAVTPDSPADRAGVQSGDVALYFDGQPVVDWNHFTDLVQNVEPGTTVPLTVERDGEPVELSIAPEINEEYDRMMIGVQLGGGAMPWMLYKNPLKQLKYDALAIVRVLQALTNVEEAPQAAKGLGGPVAIFDMLILSIQTGVAGTLGLLRFLNVNLAILNLLPIPVLDGGHIVFALWHGVTRRKVNPRVQGALVNFFAILLLGAMLLLTFNDVDRKLNIKEFFGNLFSGPTEQVEKE